MEQIKSMLTVYADMMKENDNLVEMNLYGKDYQTVDYLTYNSKEVVPGTLFICKGLSFKEDYLKEALRAGALCYVSEKKYPLSQDVPYMIVKDIRKAMPLLASQFFKEPWQKLTTIGVGGTKGKSTTVYYLKAVLDDYLKANQKKESAVVSSIDVYDGVIKKESHITTPEAVELQQHFRNAVDSGIEYLEMEVSSQALKYHRVDHITFDIAVFLNISEDHISPIEHPDFEDYFQSKLLIFNQSKNAVVNLDADYANRILENAKKCQKVVTFSTKDDKADVYAYNIRKHHHGFIFNVRSEKCNGEFELSMPGLFNIENALAVIAIANLLDIDEAYVRSGLKRAKSSGRMELFASKDNQVIAIVDYAHNKLSFEKLYGSIKEEYPDRDIISIFGSAGKKAFIRRRDLGTIAGKYAKVVYLVPEDPGEESDLEISKDIAQYVASQNCPYEIFDNRGTAIEKAILSAQKPTIVLVTGKGNETTQKYGTQYIECPSDVDYVRESLEKYNQEHE